MILEISYDIDIYVKKHFFRSINKGTHFTNLGPLLHSESIDSSKVFFLDLKLRWKNRNDDRAIKLFTSYFLSSTTMTITKLLLFLLLLETVIKDEFELDICTSF